MNADIEVVETRRQALVNHIASLYSAFSLVSGIRSIQEIETKIDQASVFLDHISNAIYGDLDGLSDMESLVSRLDEKDQQKICKILGLSMPAPALASMG